MRRLYHTLTPYVLMLFVTVLVTVVMDRWRNLLEPSISALIYLLMVVIGTTVWGIGPGLVAAFASFFAFNYFFIAPIYGFDLTRIQGIVELVIFIVIAVITSQLVRRAQAGRAEAQSREQEAVYLHELSMTLADARSEETSARLIAEHIRRAFQAHIVIITVQYASQPPSLFQTPSNATTHKPADETAPLMTSNGPSGSIRIWRSNKAFTEAEKRLLNTFAGQTALAIERAALAQAENRAKMLEESDRLKSALLSSVSHELRTPLATIRAAATSLRSGEVDWESDSRANLLNAIDEEARHLNRLVGNLLDMSRIESGALNPDFQWNDLGEIISSVLDRSLYLSSTHEIRIELPDDLPLVPVDYIQIEQVFTNLISNGLKYASTNTEIVLCANIKDDSVQVEVKNDGLGVPAEHLPLIFEKFYRPPNAKRETGTGIGLSICKGIVEAHGGRIWAENLPDSFVVRFTLPLHRTGMPQPLTPTEPEPT
jgi:two-component system, OmpR family, sensor histidine kinase KdpD